MGRSSPRLHRVVLVYVTSTLVIGFLVIVPPLLSVSSASPSFPLSLSFLPCFGSHAHSNSPQRKESSVVNNVVAANANRDGHERRPCAGNIPNNTICCDRNSSSKYDVCVMKGDVRTLSPSSSIFLYNSSAVVGVGHTSISEKIRPYPRKWETGIMATVQQLDLVATSAAAIGAHACDVLHHVPAVVFYTGGYTGNLYHEFNDGIVPLYITTHRFNKQVVIVILGYRTWWISKYRDILSQLSDYPPVNFSGDNRTHCFPSAIAGVRVHDELSIDPSRTEGNKTIFDFRRLLDDAYRPRVRPTPRRSESEAPPKLAIMSRNGSRGLENEGDVVSLGEGLGFHVQVLRPSATTDLAEMYRALNGTDVMVGVHGAALTHFLFLRPGSVFVQIVPLGGAWVAETCFGRAARRMGLMYMEYRIAPEESSLYREYNKDSPVVRQPEKVGKGWRATKEVYLDRQTVRVDVKRFRRWLVEAHRHAPSRKN